MGTLIVDTGQNLVGIYSVVGRRYVAYRGASIPRAIRRVQTAEEVVTYNGKNHDLAKLAAFAGIEGHLPLQGVHTDMRTVCWSDRIWGSDLETTYRKHCPTCPDFPDTHEGSNQRDVFMTFQLWRLWRRNELKIVDGRLAAR